MEDGRSTPPRGSWSCDALVEPSRALLSLTSQHLSSAHSTVTAQRLRSQRFQPKPFGRKMSAPSTPTSMHDTDNRMNESVRETVLQAPDTTQNKEKDTYDFMVVEQSNMSSVLRRETPAYTDIEDERERAHEQARWRRQRYKELRAQNTCAYWSAVEHPDDPWWTGVGCKLGQ